MDDGTPQGGQRPFLDPFELFEPSRRRALEAHEGIRRLFRRISDAPRDAPTASRAAAIVGVPPYALRRLFRRVAAVSYCTMLARYRVELAILIRRRYGWSVTRTREWVSRLTASGFRELFARVVGHPPSFYLSA